MPKKMTADEKFFSKLPFRPPSPLCWVWTGTKTQKGYGVFTHERKNVFVHRYSYERFTGKIPEGLTIDHLCRNPLCVNPDHLEPVTLAENTRRMRSGIVICKRGHPFTPENTDVDKRGYRTCKQCHRDYMKARRSITITPRRKK